MIITERVQVPHRWESGLKVTLDDKEINEAIALYLKTTLKTEAAVRVDEIKLHRKSPDNEKVGSATVNFGVVI